MERTARSEPEETSAHRTRLRRAGLVALAAAAVVGLGYLAVGLLLHAVADPDRLAAWTEERLERSLGRDVEVESVRLGVFPRLEVDLRGLAVDNPPDFDAPRFAEVERVSLGVALWPLLRRRIEVDDAAVSGAEVRLRVLADGRSNYGDFVPEGAEEGTAAGGSTAFRTEVGEVDVDGVTVGYRNDVDGTSVEARDVGGSATMGEPSGEGRPVELRLEAGEISASGLPGGRSLEPRPGGLEILGEAEADFRWLRIREGGLRLEPLRIGLEGRVDSLRSSVRRLDLRLVAESLDLEELAALAEDLAPPDAPAGGADGEATAAWDSLRPSGSVALDLAVRGDLGPDARPDVEGGVTVRDGGLGIPGRAPLARELAGEVRLRGDSVLLDDLRGELLDGALELSGAVAVDTPHGFRVAVSAAPRLEAWTGAAPGGATDTELSGAAELDVVVRGRPDDPAGLRATGTVRPAGVRIGRERWAGDLELPAGSLRLTGDGLTTTGLAVVAAGDTLRADVELSGLFSSRSARGEVPSLTSEVRGPRLDLDALLGRRSADSVTYGRLAFARLGGGRVAGSDPGELAAREGFRRPASLPVRGTVRATLGRLDWGPYRMEDVEMEARLSPDRLEIGRSRMSLFGGDATASFALDLVPGPLAPFSLELAFEGVETDELLTTLTPLGRLATGTASLSYATTGRLDTLLLPVTDTLSGDGRMEATDGEMRENPVTSALARTLSQPALRAPTFRRWSLPFEVRGDSLRLLPGQLRGGPVPVDFAGHVSFAGVMDVAATLQLPREAASSLAGRVGGVPAALLERVAGGEGPVAVGLGLSGTLREPRVRVEAEALRRSLEAAARQEAGQEIEERAGGLLRNLLGGRRDTAPADTAAPPDTAAPSDTTGAPPDSAG